MGFLSTFHILAHIIHTRIWWSRFCFRSIFQKKEKKEKEKMRYRGALADLSRESFNSLCGGPSLWLHLGGLAPDAEAETPILWSPDAKNWLIGRPWCWERFKTGEGDNRGWDGWMTSPTRWTWVWVSSGSWWWTGRPGVLQSTGSQRVGHDWALELNWLLSGSQTQPCAATWWSQSAVHQ